MQVPAKFRHLFWFECQFCHEEIEWKGLTPFQKRSRSCPHCGVALAIKAIPAGAHGAWVPFLRWIEGYEPREVYDGNGN